MGKRLLMNSMDLARLFKICKILHYLFIKLYYTLYASLVFLFASFTDSPGTGLPVSRHDEADL